MANQRIQNGEFVNNNRSHCCTVPLIHLKTPPPTIADILTSRLLRLWIQTVLPISRRSIIPGGAVERQPSRKQGLRWDHQSGPSCPTAADRCAGRGGGACDLTFKNYASLILNFVDWVFCRFYHSNICWFATNDLHLWNTSFQDRFHLRVKSKGDVTCSVQQHTAVGLLLC